jgi:moderate conductance mechanosensitive channel
MNLMGRVAKLLLGSALDLLVFRRGFSACAPDGVMSRAPVCSLRALRVCLIAALLFSAFLPQLASAASPSPAAENPSVTELEQLVQTLKNDKGREAFVAQLDALLAAQRGVAAKPAEPEDLISVLSDRINALGDEVLAGAAVVVDAPLLLAWVKGQIANEYTRALWIQVAYSLMIVFGMGLVAEWAARRLLARVLPRAPAPIRKRLALRLLLIGGALVVEALPVAVFAGTAIAALAMTIPPFAMARYALWDLIQATIAVRLILTVAKAVLVPVYADDNLIPASEETRNYLLIWARRFTCWGIFGYALAAATWWLGVPGGIYALLLKISALVLVILGVVFILQNRAVVGGWIAGSDTAESAGLSRVRRRLAEIWHILAIVYIGAIYLAYALRVEGGSGFILRATLVSLVVIVAARLLVRFIEQLSARGFAVAPDLKARFPELEKRTNRYLPILTGVSAAGIYALAFLLVLQAWDVRSFAWFETGLGRQTAGALLSIGLVLAIALAVWELFSAAIERQLAGLDAHGAPSRARRRTLLPLLRTTLLCVIVAIAGLTILSQIGVSIAPLLAGAGVVGVAVGFGSQALVKDVITGLFILVEDQVAVGDVVDLGKEHKGVVEAISIRTVRLRDQTGAVHTVPFSEVTSVKNMTKDFAYAVARIAVAYREDTDRVTEILRQVCDELNADTELRPWILDPFDYQGIDSLEESSVALVLRVRTVAGKQFIVGRALNRLIKIAFEKHGIAMRDPAPMLLASPPNSQVNAAPDRHAETQSLLPMRPKGVSTAAANRT